MKNFLKKNINESDVESLTPKQKKLINLVDMEFYVPIPYRSYNGQFNYFDFTKSNKNLGITDSVAYAGYTNQLIVTENSLRINLINKLNCFLVTFLNVFAHQLIFLSNENALNSQFIQLISSALLFML